MRKLQRVAWEKRTPLALSTLRCALSGKQCPESGEVLHALQVLQDWECTAAKPLLTAS